MAKTVTRADIRTRVRDRGEFLAPYITDTELNNLINDGIAAFYDFIVTLDEEWQMIASTSPVSVVAGTSLYSFPSDFYFLKGVDAIDSSLPTGRRTLHPFEHPERNFSDNFTSSSNYNTQWRVRSGKLELKPTPGWSGQIELLYVPVAPTLTDDVTTFDSRNLWTEWIINWCCMMCAIKQEQDEKPWQRLIAATELRIVGIRRADKGSAMKRTDIRKGINPRFPYGRY